MKSIAVVVALAAAAIGGFILFAGRSADQATHEVLTLPDVAATAAAQADVSAALPAIQAYATEHGGYVGVTIDSLRQLSPGLDPSISLHDLTATSYCVQSTVRTAVASITGPGGSVVSTACP
jgi:hypothetical protein